MRLGRIACCCAPNSRPPATKALHTIYGNSTSIVSSSCAYKCPEHVQQIISTINHSAASSWFSSLHLYNDARTNRHQIHSLVSSHVHTHTHTHTHTHMTPVLVKTVLASIIKRHFFFIETVAVSLCSRPARTSA